MAKVSVIVPVYGVEKYLRQAIESIQNQVLKDLEIILVDDGSQDSCPDIIDEFAEKDSRIIAVHKENGGYGSACNKALEIASGEYIAILEPDDYIDLNMYEDLYKIAQEYDSDVVKSGFYNVFTSGEKFYIKKENWEKAKFPQDRSFKINEFPEFLYFHPSIWTCLYKREFLNNNGIRFKEVSGAGWTDNLFQVQTMCLAERINYTEKAYYYWRRKDLDYMGELKDYRIPFERCEEIESWLREKNIKDCGIINNLHRRELAYMPIVLAIKNISDLEDCYARIKCSMKKLEETGIYTIPNLRKEEKKIIELGKTNPKILRWKYLLKKLRKYLYSVRLNSREQRIILLGRIVYIGNIRKNNSKIKIMQVFHKKFPVIRSSLVVPVHVGREIANKKILNSLRKMCGDNDYHDNISNQNGIYCELTAQYYAWKNTEFKKNTEYIGLMHYRRIFDFKNKNLTYSYRNIAKQIKPYDVIVVEKMPCYSKIASSPVEDIRTHWQLEHNIKDLDIIYKRTIEKFPQYKDSFDKILKSDSLHWYNMFIMKTELFDEYSKWLFDILNVDINKFVEKNRLKGYFAEILLNVFLEKNKESLRIKEVPCFKIEDNIYLKNSFFENIFSVKNQISTFHKKYKVITLLGLKLKIRNPKVKPVSYNTVQDGQFVIADSLLLAHNKQISSSDFLKFNEKFVKLIPDEDLTNEERAIYLDSLIVNQKYNEAKVLLNSYIQKYGFSEIWAFSNIAIFAKELGYHFTLNDIAVEVYLNLLSEDTKKRFKTLIENKTVAIVGNGPSELNTGHGKLIDSHDIVIRINNYTTLGYEKDYGTKSDIWARGIGASDVVDKTQDHEFKACIYAADLSKFKLSYPLLKVMERNLKNKDLISIAMDSISATKIKKDSGIHFPTTGFNTIMYILNTCNPRSVDCYGFSFNQKEVDGYATHYFNDRTKEEAIDRSAVHSFNDEASYLKTILTKEDF